MDLQMSTEPAVDVGVSGRVGNMANTLLQRGLPLEPAAPPGTWQPSNSTSVTPASSSACFFANASVTAPCQPALVQLLDPIGTTYLKHNGRLSLLHTSSTSSCISRTPDNAETLATSSEPRVKKTLPKKKKRQNSKCSYRSGTWLAASCQSIPRGHLHACMHTCLPRLPALACLPSD